MGCGCKKKKAKASGVQTAQSRALSEPVNTGEANVNAVQENKEYQGKVRDALKQLMDIKRRKRAPRHNR